MKITTHYRNQRVKSVTCFKVLIAYYSPIIQYGLTNLINQQTDFAVCGNGNNAGDIFEAIDKYHPDIIIHELSCTNCSSLLTVENIRIRFPDIPILVLSPYDEFLFIERYLNAGVHGYIELTATSEKIIFAMRKILKGEIYVSEQIQNRILNKYVHNKTLPNVSPLESFSNRELEVFQFLGKGLKVQQIADELHLSIHTVSSHIERIKKKMHLTNALKVRLHAVQWMINTKQN